MEEEEEVEETMSLPTMEYKMGTALHNYNNIQFKGTSLCIDCGNIFMDDELTDGRCITCNAEWNKKEDRLSVKELTAEMREELKQDRENAREDLELMS